HQPRHSPPRRGPTLIDQRLQPSPPSPSLISFSPIEDCICCTIADHADSTTHPPRQETYTTRPFHHLHHPTTKEVRTAAASLLNHHQEKGLRSPNRSHPHRRRSPTSRITEKSPPLPPSPPVLQLLGRTPTPSQTTTLHATQHPAVVRPSLRRDTACPTADHQPPLIIIHRRRPS
ncbi:hypothetical protein Dimus_001792, partial [Dionaea muscipula]